MAKRDYAEEWRGTCAWTVWRFLSPSSGETKVVAQHTEPFEPEHEYQQVLGRYVDCTRAEAIRRARGS